MNQLDLKYYLCACDGIVKGVGVYITAKFFVILISMLITLHITLYMIITLQLMLVVEFRYGCTVIYTSNV